MPGTHHQNSPSKLDAIAACPGRGRAASGMEHEESSAAAAEGTMLHAIMAGEIEAPADLTEEQKDLLQQCHEYEGLHFSHCGEWQKECHVTLMDDEMGIITEGTADLVTVDGDTIKALDWKFGRMWVKPDGLQAKAYAAALMQTFGVGVVEFHIFQPRAGGGKPVLFSDFAALRDEIQQVIARADDATAPFIPGDHCCYCPIHHTCTACQSWTAGDAVAARDALAETNAAALLDPRTVGTKLKAWRFAKKLGAELEAMCSEMTEAGQNTGFELSERAGRKTITDPQKAYELLQNIITLPEFMSLVQIPTGKLKNAVVGGMKQKLGCTMKEAEVALWLLIAPVIEEGKPSSVMSEIKSK